VHIFSHSGPHGIAGRALADRLGLYQDGVDAAARARGARTIADVPINVFSDNVVIVLHGCRTADGADSFAQALFERLATQLRSPTVFAHPNRGCCGRDNSWREFSRAAPAGRARRSIAPHYSGKGCCT
jgi:hypothetical protein